MKQFVLYITVALCLQAAVSCKKDNDSAPVTKTIEVQLDPNESYQYDLGTFGDEEGVEINRQATRYAISSTDRKLSSGQVVYTYQPSLNFTGTDEVELKSSRGSDGASANDDIIITTIKFIIH